MKEKWNGKSRQFEWLSSHKLSVRPPISFERVQVFNCIGNCLVTLRIIRFGWSFFASFFSYFENNDSGYEAILAVRPPPYKRNTLEPNQSHKVEEWFAPQNDPNRFSPPLSLSLSLCLSLALALTLTLTQSIHCRPLALSIALSSCPTTSNEALQADDQRVLMNVMMMVMILILITIMIGKDNNKFTNTLTK